MIDSFLFFSGFFIGMWFAHYRIEKNDNSIFRNQMKELDDFEKMCDEKWKLKELNAKA